MSTINVNFSDASISRSSFNIGDTSTNNFLSEDYLHILQEAFISAQPKLKSRPDYQNVLQRASKIAKSGSQNALVAFLKEHAGTFASQVVIGALGDVAADIILKLIAF